MNDLFWLTILLFAVAAVLRSEFFFYLLYVVVGLQLVVRLWLRQGTRSLSWRRRAPSTGFPGEPLTVELELANHGMLPLPWLALHESLPASLHTPPMVREVLSLGAGERRTLGYTLVGRQRGYYRIGPLSLSTGDVLGLGERVVTSDDYAPVTIFPPVLPLADLGLPASLPYGTLPARQRLFSDPARPAGVRPYQASDGVRRIDWKSTARSGTPLVRRHQPAIALETLIGLAFSQGEYEGRHSYELMERALVAAASLAADLAGRGQAIGLCAGGCDAATGAPAAPLAIGHGRGHLIELLGLLGRQELPGVDLLPSLLRAASHLGWGSTVVVITGQSGPALVAALLPLRQRGLNVALIMTEPSPDALGLPRRHGIASYGLWRDGRPSAQ